MLNQSQWNFAQVTTVLLSWCVQNFIVVGWIYYEQEYYEVSSNFEFDRNMVSGTGRDGEEIVDFNVTWWCKCPMHTKLLWNSTNINFFVNFYESGLEIEGCPLVKSNLIWALEVPEVNLQAGCPFSNINVTCVKCTRKLVFLWVKSRFGQPPEKVNVKPCQN